MYSSKPRVRRAQAVVEMSASPPPYTRTDTNNYSEYQTKPGTNTNNNIGAAASRYAEKGREMLAKVVFYRQSNERQ